MPPSCDPITAAHNCAQGLFAFLSLDGINPNFSNVHRQRTKSHLQSLNLAHKMYGGITGQHLWEHYGNDCSITSLCPLSLWMHHFSTIIPVFNQKKGIESHCNARKMCRRRPPKVMVEKTSTKHPQLHQQLSGSVNKPFLRESLGKYRV